ncbi:MAG: hypothetical protein GY757_27235, partial [bacterium]|nr:hypothetical protein [bacterium]
DTFMPLEAIPLTSTGKIDRKALPEVVIKKNETYTAPRDEVEKKIVEIWQTLLGKDKVGIHDNFFMSGGDSIKSIQVVASHCCECIGAPRRSIRHLRQCPPISHPKMVLRENNPAALSF